MKLYLDDDLAAAVLERLLANAGHDVQVPADVHLSGHDDSVHFRHAIRESRVLMSGNHDDFENLHDLVIDAGGHHPGILIVRRDNDPKRDLTPRGIVTAIKNLEATGIDMNDSFYILNHWR